MVSSSPLCRGEGGRYIEVREGGEDRCMCGGIGACVEGIGACVEGRDRCMCGGEGQVHVWRIGACVEGRDRCMCGGDVWRG